MCFWKGISSVQFVSRREVKCMARCWLSTEAMSLLEKVRALENEDSQMVCLLATDAFCW